MTVESILAQARSRVASAASAASSQEFDYKPVKVSVPAVTVQPLRAGSTVTVAGYSPVPLPSGPALSATLSAVTYVPSTEPLVGFAPPSISLEPLSEWLYGESPPTGSAGAPDIDYPQASFFDVSTSAGLTDIHAPVVAVGTVPSWLGIPELSYDLQTIDKFDYDVPEISDIPEAALLGSPEKLASLIDPAVVSVLVSELDGRVLDGKVQALMYRLGIEQLVKKRIENERELFTSVAAAGFSCTTGSLISALADLNMDVELAQLDVFAKNRDELYARAKAGVETALKQSMALELANFAVHTSYCAKLIETLQVNTAMYVSVLNSAIDMHNYKVEAARLLVGQYQAYVQALVGQYEAFSRVQASKQAVLDTNAAKADVYDAQVGTTGAVAELYALEVEQETLKLKEFNIYLSGLLKNIEVSKLNLSAYEQAIKAYSMANESDKAKLESYSASIRASASAADVYEANWQAYATAWGAESAVNDAVRSFNSSSLQSLQSEIGVFKAAASAERAYLSAALDTARAGSDVVRSFVSGVDAQVRYTSQQNRAEAEKLSAQQTINFAKAQSDLVQQVLSAQAAGINATIDAGLASSTAMTAAGLAQAAYSVQSVSAHLGGSASGSKSDSYTGSWSNNTNATLSHSYTQSESVSA